MKQTTRLLSLLLVLVLCLSVLPMGAMAMIEDGWQKIDGYWYYYKDGSPLTNYWVNDPTGSDNWYRLGPDGKMITSAWTSDSDGEYYQLSSGKSAMGWLKLDGVWYYFDPGNYGAAVTGWQKIGSAWYYFWSDCTMASSYWLEDPADSNTWYYFGSNGKMVTSQWVKEPWMDDEGTTHYSWYYQLSSGKGAMEWQKIGGVWYYFDPDNYCEMATGGPYEIDGNYYFFKDSGALFTGWKKFTDNYYNDEIGEYVDYTWWAYFTSNGAVENGWKKIGGKWYYFKDYEMKADYWVDEDDGDSYRLGSDGAMVTSKWVEDEGEWFYQLSSGKSAKGWLKLGGVWYYFDPGYYGVMVTGPLEIDGRLYFFKTSGALFTGWKESENGWMYFTSNGAVEYGWKQINGKWYQFENRICLNP